MILLFSRSFDRTPSGTNGTKFGRIVTILQRIHIHVKSVSTTTKCIVRSSTPFLHLSHQWPLIITNPSILKEFLMLRRFFLYQMVHCILSTTKWHMNGFCLPLIGNAGSSLLIPAARIQGITLPFVLNLMESAMRYVTVTTKA